MTKIIELKPELNHPYMKTLQDTIEKQKGLLELLENKDRLLRRLTGYNPGENTDEQLEFKEKYDL